MSKQSRLRPSKPNGKSPTYYSSDDEADTRPAIFAASTIPTASLNRPPSASAKLAAHAPHLAGASSVAGSSGRHGEGSGSSVVPETAAGDAAVVAAVPAAAPVPATPFRFLDLPTELRLKVYGYHFEDLAPVLDLTPLNYVTVFRKLQLLRVCRSVYQEASHLFYSTHAVRVFPTYGARFFKTRRPLLARLKPRQRQALTRLELCLGPGFGRPPRSWVVNHKLGLRDCVHVRRLSVFVQIDPSLSWLDGYRKQGFYEAFSRDLLDGILRDAPAIDVVEFDAVASVRKGCPIMVALLQTARAHGKAIAWGPERGWTDADDDDDAAGPPAAGLDHALADLAATTATLTIHDSPVPVGA